MPASSGRRLVPAMAVLAAVAATFVAPMPAQGDIRATVAVRTPLPTDRLHFGLANGPGSDYTWFTSSGVPWRYRYQYLAGGVNTGGTPGDPCGANAGWQTWNTPAGQFVTDYINDSVAAHAIPVFTYYEIVQSNPSAGVESAETTKITTLCTMQAYWADFTVLMQKIGAYGGQAVVHVEPDFWGFMEHVNADPTAIPADVANTNNADLTGLPNTVAGMAYAFLKLRDKYAPNALLGIHASDWGSGVDLSTDTNSSTDPNAEADKVAAFLNKAGIVGNPSGVSTWDLVFNDVADHDAGWYNPTADPHWWDRNNVNLPNFSRWLAFMSRLHSDTGRPLVEWQVPVGNQYYDTMNNTDGHYQDNRAEYFLAHPDQLVAAGIVAVLFGSGNAGQTTYTDAKNDGITNPAPVTSFECSMCNNHTSTWPDDDGGFLRVMVGAYYGETPCSTVTLNAAPPSPSVSGTPITLTGAATGCPNPRYRFWVRPPGGSWGVVQDYGAANTFTWNPSVAGTYSLEVDARDSIENVAYDVVFNMTYTVTGASACATAGLSANPASPQAPATQVTWTGTSTGCPNPVYRFWELDPGARWSMVQNYSASNTYTWHSPSAAGTYRFEVDVRDASETTAYDVVSNVTYVLQTAPPCTAAGLSANPGSPQPPATQVTWTGSSTGCPSARYRFWELDPGSRWTVVQDYSASNTYTWHSPAAGGSYRFEVDVRDASETTTYDVVANMTYVLQTAPPCTAAGLGASPGSPGGTGVTITLTGSSSTCPNPVYRFWVRPPGGSWQVVRDYASGSTFAWVPTTAGAYSLEVDVRDASESTSYDTVSNAIYMVNGCVAAALLASPPAPQAHGTPITLTGSATCLGTPTYRFWVRAPGGVWQIVRDYSTTSTITWTPASAGTYSLEVDVRDQNATASYETVSNITYSVS